jgi:hypothetical protein
MNTTYKQIPTEFGPDTGFEVKPVAEPGFRVVEESRFERLKGRLLAQQLGAEAWEGEFTSRLRRAANEAAAVAWLTPYPFLVFPILFEEKAQSAKARAVRQEQVRRRSRSLTEELLCELK